MQLLYKSHMKNRFWEIDFFRGIAIVKMIISNFIFDLVVLASFNLGAMDFLWDFSRLTFAAIMFLFLIGISLTISFSRVQKNSSREIYKKYFIRGSRLFFLGILITIITWFLFNSGTIYFGVLHLIGISIIIATPLLRFKKLNLLLGISLIIIGIYLQGLVFDFPWLLWLGFIPYGFYTLDYFPLLPWFGVVLLGMFFGKVLYPNGKRRFNIREVDNPITNFFCFLGRYSLYVYLIHQPVIMAILYLFVF